jgi:segregation and condensation protein B
MTNILSKADILEAIFFASDSPLPTERLAQILEVSAREAEEELQILREEKARIGGLQVVEVAGGWQMLTKAAVAPFVAKLREAPRQKLSRAAFEVLAIVAYRQPITRGEVEELRGVDCSRPLTFLLDKKLVHFAGRKEAPGRPWLYETTPQFLEHFGLRSIADLPPLSELAELNESALEGAALQLFSRAPMQETAGEADEQDENAVVQADAEEVLSEAESEAAQNQNGEAHLAEETQVESKAETEAEEGDVESA